MFAGYIRSTEWQFMAIRPTYELMRDRLFAELMETGDEFEFYEFDDVFIIEGDSNRAELEARLFLELKAFVEYMKEKKENACNSNNGTNTLSNSGPKVLAVEQLP